MMRLTKNIFAGLLLTAVFFMAGTEEASAQRYFKKEISVGGRGGITMSKMRLDPKVPQNFLMGVTAGAAFRYIEEKYFGFQIELNYAQHGWKEFFENEPHSFSRTLNYMELPFMTHIFFGNQRVRGFVNLGPQIGFYLSDSYTSNFDVLQPPVFGIIRETAQYTQKVTRKFDYGITGGAGFELRFGKHIFDLEGRYYFGLGDIFPNHKRDVFSASSIQSIYVTLTYMFRLR